jgi:hypothetical protein
MSFSDSDWTRDPPLRPRLPPSQRRMWILATAIAVSCVALAIAVYGIERMLDASARSAAFEHIGDATQAPPGASVTPPAAASTSPIEAAVPPPPVSTASEPAVAAPAAPAAPAASGSASAALAALEAEMRQRARETAEQAAIEAARRKERAWQRFYQRPEYCADNPTAAQMVQCANHHIRARKEFEERYGAGRL